MPRWLLEPPPSLQRCPWVPRPHPRTSWNLQNLSGSLSPHTVQTAPGVPRGPPRPPRPHLPGVIFGLVGGAPPSHLEGAVAAAAGHICSFRHGWSCISRRPVLVGGQPRRSRRGRSGDTPAPPPRRLTLASGRLWLSGGPRGAADWRGAPIPEIVCGFALRQVDI